MAEMLTPQQAQAVTNRGGKLLVSAAAGSGKTKVLVDRLMGYLMAETDPANMDDFLIITYTKAAASELRGKIAAKLTEKMAEFPENKHLQRQMQRLYLAKISTVHSFCSDILREYAYKLDIPADFRVADENECSVLRDTVLERILEEAYSNAQQDADFRSFVDTLGLGRDDRLVPEILLQVYDSARCHLDPDGWLDECLGNARVDKITDAGQTIWGRYLMEDLFAYLDLQMEALECCVALTQAEPDMEKLAAYLQTILNQYRALRSCKSWDEVVSGSNIDYGRLPNTKKCVNAELCERIKAVRDGAKDGLAKKLKNFVDSSAVSLEDMEKSCLTAQGIIALVRRFGREYDRIKRTRRILDFGDLEHRTLDLLLGKNRSGFTSAAAEIGNRFREVMVDEYQDSNAVQDAIFSALTRQKQNCFMVGDVKQSIYQFRLADPTIFIEKYNAYPDAAQASPGEGRKVMLSSNFRSCGAVLEGVNDIFRLCMTPTVGGLYYGEDEALHEGIPHDHLGEPEVELMAIPAEENAYDAESNVVADRITELLDGSHFIREKDALRPIRPEDIAILLRSPGSLGSHFRDALSERGIRCCTGGGEDLLKTEEIGVLRALLQTIGNPRRDIPLVAVLASPIFGFSGDDLAALREKNRVGCIYDCLSSMKTEKSEHFLQVLEELRWAAQMETLAGLVERVFRLTGLDGIYGAMDGGAVRKSNLQTFYRLAVDFETNGRRDLTRFLEYLDTIEGKGMIAPGEQTAPGAVTIMSIHKSKGLEFPVVFVSGLARRFNREDLKKRVLCDKELGLGLSAVDEKNRTYYPTVAKRAIAVKMVSDSLSEEMRVLYVALTRAKDRLIMTYADKSLAGDVQELALRLGIGSTELITRDALCPGKWVLMAALQRAEAGQLFALGCKPQETVLHDHLWKISVVEESTHQHAASEKKEKPQMLTAQQRETLLQSLSFRYDSLLATVTPSKQTATQLKGRQKDAEAAEHTYEAHRPAHTRRKPAFLGTQTGGAAIGTATHQCLQYIRYEECATLQQVEAEISRLVSRHYLTAEQGALVDSGAIYAFFQTELGRKLCMSANVLREFKFSVLDGGERYDSALQGEQILLQGVVDCAIVEEDGITVIDFKTDYVTRQTLPEKVSHYAPQILAYAGALERIYGKKVKQSLLYFFGIGEAVAV